MLKRAKLSTKLLLTNIILFSIILSTISFITASIVSSTLYSTIDNDLVNMATGLSSMPLDDIIQDIKNPATNENPDLQKGEYYYALTDNSLYLTEKLPRTQLDHSRNVLTIYSLPVIDINSESKGLGLDIVDSIASYQYEGNNFTDGTQSNYIDSKTKFEVRYPKWRICSTYINGSTTKLWIATPLDTVYSSMYTLMLVLITSCIAILFIGSMVSKSLISKNLQQLAELEISAYKMSNIDYNTTDEFEYLPESMPDTTEVGSLQRSMNILLTKIIESLQQKKLEQSKTKTFVSDSSHELRTPLAIIKGYVELYKLGIAKEDKIDELFGNIDSAVNRLQHLVEDLLTLARLDEGKDLAFSHFDIVPLLKKSISDLNALSPNRQIEFITPFEEYFIHSDKDKLLHIFNNLIGNINKYTSKEDKVEIFLTQKENLLNISFVDHGKGVKKENLNLIFDRFMVEDDSRVVNNSGSGLGLSIVKTIMTALGGTVKASTTKGGGLTISMEFHI